MKRSFLLCFLLLLGGLGYQWVYRAKGPAAPAPNVAPDRAPLLFRFSGLPVHGNLDPATATSLGQLAVLYRIAEGLVSLDPATLELRPALAERYEIDQDARTFTFHLRQGVLFHDGSLFTAGDVAQAFEHLLRPQSRTRNSWILDEVEGAEAYARGQTEKISGLEAPDPHTLRIRLRRPSALFLMKLTTAGALILSSHSRESLRNGGGQRPAGTGPFRFSARLGQDVLLERNPTYRGPPAAIDRLIIMESPAPEKTIEMFASGEVDLVVEPPGDPEDLRKRFGQSYVVWPVVGLSLLCVNHRNGPLAGDIGLRRAVAAAIDRTALAGITGGRGSPASQIVPSVLKESQPSAEKNGPAGAPEILGTASAQRGENPLRQPLRTKAPPLLQTAHKTFQRPGSTTERKLPVLRLGNLSLSPGVMARIAGDLEKSGFDVKIVEVEDPFDPGWDLLGYTWWADYPEPSSFLYSLLSSTRANVYGNWGRYRNEVYDGVLGKAMETPSPGERMDLYRQAEELALTDVALVPLLFEMESILVQPKWAGSLTLSPLGRFYLPLERLVPRGVAGVRGEAD